MKKTPSTIMVILMALMFTACQVTPENPIVVKKDTERLIEDAQTTQTIDEPRLSLRERTGAPETYTFMDEDASLHLRIDVDAVVECPDANAMPMARVAPADFDADLAQRLFDALCAGYEMYDQNQRMTKKEIEEQILVYQQTRQSPDYADIPAGESEIDFWIDTLQKEYPNAPDTKEPVKVDGTLYTVPLKDPNGNVCATYLGIDARGKSGGGEVAFSVKNNYVLEEALIFELGNGAFNMIPVHSGAQISYINLGAIHREWDEISIVTDMSLVPVEAQSALKLTPAQAQLKADELLSSTDMCLAQMRLVSGGKETYGYKLIYTRQVDGIPCAITSGQAGGENWAERTAPTWAYECLTVLINDSGIQKFYWNSPVTVTELITSNADLLPFADIITVFERMMRITYAPMANGGSDRLLVLKAKHIQLGLQRVNEPNNIEAGLLVPVWSFYGEIITESKNGARDRLITGSDCLLTINAIDGSIIDLNKGY